MRMEKAVGIFAFVHINIDYVKLSSGFRDIFFPLERRPSIIVNSSESS